MIVLRQQGRSNKDTKIYEIHPSDDEAMTEEQILKRLTSIYSITIMLMNQEVIAQLLYIAHHLWVVELWVEDDEDIFSVCMNIHNKFVKSGDDYITEWLAENEELLTLDFKRRMKDTMIWMDRKKPCSMDFDIKAYLYWYRNSRSTW